MTNKHVSPYGGSCQVEIRLPWSVAEELVEQGPAIIAAIGEAVRVRKQEAERQAEGREALAEACEQRKAENRAIAAEVEAEIKRRSNGPGQRQRLIKQLAAEYDLPTYELQSVLKVFREEQEAKRLSRQKLRALTLRLQGFTHREIGQKLELSTRHVGTILRSEDDLLESIRQALADLKEEETGGSP